MAKKKISRTGSPKSSKQTPAKKVVKKTAKKVVMKTVKEPRGPGYGNLAVWKQIPGTFTYTSVEPLYEWKLICKAKRAMSQYELDECFAAHKIFNPFFAKSKETLEFDAIENASQAIRDIIQKPTPKFIAKVRAFFDKHVPSRSGANASSRQPFGCPQCHGKGWVCEEHLFVPWQVKCGDECPCGAPEMSCRTCNPNTAIIMGPGDFSFGAPGIEGCPVCDCQRWVCVKHKKPWKLKHVGCDCSPGEPCPFCNPNGHLKLGTLKVIRTGLN
ncbi:MAG: hypothetical protein JWM68_3639 [Verrucomicrobiales bacterium]|nr:hypothetical protein [Verrucomicrobiales bacterium]